MGNRFGELSEMLVLNDFEKITVNCHASFEIWCSNIGAMLHFELCWLWLCPYDFIFVITSLLTRASARAT